MPSSLPRVERALLEFRALEEGDGSLLESFSCGDDDLDDFIRSDAQRLHRLQTVLTYVACYEGSAVGYVSLLTDAIVLDSRERKKLRAPTDSTVYLGHNSHPVVPALKLARLAVDANARAQFAHIGTELVRFAFLQGLTVAGIAGCRLLTVDAYPTAIGFYEKLGFARNLSKQYESSPHPSMRLDLCSSPSWL